MYRCGIFGGSFNPIHTGHIALAHRILEQACLDEIWFVVSPLNPFKASSSDLLDDELRLALTRKALKDEPHLMVSDCEFHLPRPSYMWDTLTHLSRRHPDWLFVLIIGADNWVAFDRWAHAEDILSHYDVVVYPREGYAVDAAALPPRVCLVDTDLCRISSTEIRRRVRAGEPIEGLVPANILDDVKRYYASASTR